MNDYNLDELSPAEITQLIVTDDELRMTIADNMAEYGGSFVKALAECFYRADRINRAKLADAFMNYVLEYQPSKWRKEAWTRRNQNHNPR